MTAPDRDRDPGIGTWLAFSGLCVGMFMAILDVQVVAASLPTIQSALAMRPDEMSWVQTSYLIAEVVAIPVTGFLTRALTMRWLAVISIGIFVVASLGCAASGSFTALLVWRVIQGLAGGWLIPQVFAAGFVLFPGRGQALATTIAGVLAVLAPTLGPLVGGWITDAYDWPWLFLINVPPGLAAIAVVASLLPRQAIDLAALRRLDVVGLVLMATALAALQIALKQAPESGWASFAVLGLFAESLGLGMLFVIRSLAVAAPVVDLRALADRDFALGSGLSFILGIGLYGSVYLMPVFLAFVRNHSAFEIGQTMMVMGAAQLALAPVAVFLERRVSARLLAATAFALFALGLAMSAFQTRATDFAEMLVPQIFRGMAIMLCLLPPIRLALAHQSAAAVPNASGLFNLLRNLGGAIGIALIDTVLYGRTPQIGERLGAALAEGDVATAKAVGLPLDRFLAHVPGTPVEPQVLAYVEAAVRRQATVEAVNEAWLLLAALTLAGALAVAVLRPQRS
ncbi:MAG TPA: DHA2 family efflux MFS transporter permease subunit [Hyphomicrobiaceae bacterium]|nr:DHA2 family efflux MFS transporter permease subunit [Hyphomicrobiaceae bacterium]